MDDMRPQSRSQEEARPRERAHRGRKLAPAVSQLLVDQSVSYPEQSYSPAIAVYGNGFNFNDFAVDES